MAELLNGEDTDKAAIIKTWGLKAEESDYAEAIEKDCWDAREALCWLKGRNPIWCRGSAEEYYSKEADLIKRALRAGVLTSGSTPRQWIEWAISKGWGIPLPLLEWFQKPGKKIKEASKKIPTTGDGDTYQKREKDFDEWLVTSHINIKALQVKTIFEQVRQHNRELWNIGFSTFRSDFWKPYANKKDLKKRGGRPPKK